MLTDSLYLHNVWTWNPFPVSITIVLIVVSVVWLSWRLWRFTLVPLLLRPDEPKVLPYWIPFIGHTWQFVRNPETLINSGYAYFGSSQPFALCVAGRRAVVLRDVADVAAVWKNTEAALSFDPFGISRGGLRRVFADPRALIPDEETRAKALLIRENPRNEGYMNLERDWFRAQLLAPEALARLQRRYRAHLGGSLAWDAVSRNTVYLLPSSGTVSVSVSLRLFCRYTVSHCSTLAFFGRGLQRRLPPFLARGSHAAKDRAMDGLVAQEEGDGLEWLFKTMIQELGYLGVAERDVAGIVMIIIWAINNNAHKIAFWILAHLLHGPPAYLAAVRAEISAAYSPPSPESKGEEEEESRPDLDVLLRACPHLDAIWYEALRLYNATSAVREAVAPCTVGGKQIRVGDQLVAPFRQFHLDQGIFGADAAEFNPDRFLENKNLQRTKGYAPFGGGHTYCPGRLFAQREIYMFIAETLWRFELEVVGEEKRRMPQVDTNTPSAAAMGPDRDVVVQLRPRAIIHN
ncbi:cytochrome P450 [Diplogelasinospora grovesii]|uniref:Cytochrome P450 n=1 Tax=Diplogelasinospora grovesii TaxID=303347 RepID=A0AAN6S1D1_9PEZI|nr:cytochrome P450 [Diplogelasinospora grovesii]